MRLTRPDAGAQILWLIAALAVALLFVGAFFVLPPRMIQSRKIPTSITGTNRAKLELQAQSDRDKLRNDVRGTAVQALGGFVLALGAYLTLRQFRLTRET